MAFRRVAAEVGTCVERSPADARPFVVRSFRFAPVAGASPDRLRVEPQSRMAAIAAPRTSREA
jgi:hypothetical protein